jgi:hypothetical protein
MDKTMNIDNFEGHAKQMLIDYLRRVRLECKNADIGTREGLLNLKEQIDKANIELRLLLERSEVPSYYIREYDEKRQKEEYHELLGICDLMMTNVEHQKALLYKVPTEDAKEAGSSQSSSSSSPHSDHARTGSPNAYQPWEKIISVHRKDQTLSFEEFNEFMFPSTSVERTERLMIFKKASLSGDQIIDVPTKQGWFRLHRSELGFSVSKIRLTPLQEMVVDLRTRLQLLYDANLSTKEDAETFRKFCQSYVSNPQPVYGGLPSEDVNLYQEIEALRVKINEKWGLIEEKTVKNVTPPSHLQANINCSRHHSLQKISPLAGKSRRLPREEWVLRDGTSIEKEQQQQQQPMHYGNEEKYREDVLKSILTQNEILKSQCQALQNENALLKEKNAYLSNIEKCIVRLERDVEIIYSIIEDVD